MAKIVIDGTEVDVPPEFNLEVHNQRWWGRTRRAADRQGAWESERATPFMMVTKPSWQSDISPMVEALLASRDREFLRVSFQKKSPHFRAVLPVDAVAPDVRTTPLITSVVLLPGITTPFLASKPSAYPAGWVSMIV